MARAAAHRRVSPRAGRALASGHTARHAGDVWLLALGGSDCEALESGALGQPVNTVSSLAYAAAAGYVLRRGGPPAPALALVGVGSVLYHGPMPPGAGPVHDASLVAVPVAAVAVASRRRTFPRPPAAAVAALAAGGVVNRLTRTGAPLCAPDSLLQGRALWHVLTAVGAGLWLARWAPEPGAASTGHERTRAPRPRRRARARHAHGTSCDDRASRSQEAT